MSGHEDFASLILINLHTWTQEATCTLNYTIFLTVAKMLGDMKCDGISGRFIHKYINLKAIYKKGIRLM